MPGETPEDTVAREISEELNIPVTVVGVLVVTYRCSPMTTTQISDLRLSHEHSQRGSSELASEGRAG